MAGPWSFLWSESWFQTLSPYAKLTYLNLATHPRINSLGLVHVAPVSIAGDCGLLDGGEAYHALKDLAEREEVLQDESRGLVWVARYAAVHPPATAGEVRRWEHELTLCPVGSPLRQRVAAAAGQVAIRLAQTKFDACPAVILEALTASGGTV